MHVKTPSSPFALLTEPAYAAMRVMFGVLFWFHGAQKLFGMFGSESRPVGSLLWVAGVIESAGGALIALGLFTPFAAFLASGEMAVAYVRSHAPRNLWPIQNDGELAALYCFAFLYIAARGAGKFSLDAIRRR